MKKLMYAPLAIMFMATVLFVSCSKEKEKEIIPPMLGYWKCVGIGANVLGTSTNTIGENVIKYFSIGYAGVGNAGVYARVGVDDVTALASLTRIDKETWKDFLSAGKYTFDASAGTITHTATNGSSKTYNYIVSGDGNTLKLIEHTIHASSAVNSALDILNSLLGTNATSTVGVEYTYEKLSGKEAFEALSSVGK
jgi:hypothetical protein